MTTPHVQLLGAPRLRQARSWHPFSAEQRYRLLAYLAYHGEWLGRDRLAHLFWPDRPDDAARRNLRKLLYTVRALELDPPLERDGDALRWRVVHDVAGFLAAVDRGDWSGAAERWRGEPLQGLDGGGPIFDDWLGLEREHLRDRWRRAVLARAGELEAGGDPREAGRALQALLEHDDLDEEALQAWLRLAAAGDDRVRALHAYEAFAERLARELDLEPTATTRRLVGALRGDAVPTRAREPAPPPAAVDPLVGRAAELARLEALLAGGARLITVIGPGGIGKSRLAAEALRRHPAPGDAELAAFVTLDALGEPAGIPAAVADALGLPLGGGDPLTQLVRAIGARPALLVLDTLEHLLAGAPILRELLDACPDLRLIVTSRARLGLAGEQLLPLGGLATAAGDPTAAPTAAPSDAAALFLERARRIDPDLAPEPAPAGVLEAIARQVEGSPLALELAAAWVRTLPLDAIAREIAADLDFLAQDAPDAPTRHRSLRATFERSWALLTPEERRVLGELAVFRGGFTLDAARWVTNAPLPVLAALVDRSLLRRDARGRYDRHPLVYQYAREKLDERAGAAARLGERHARWFLRRLEEVPAGERGVAGPLERLEPELENVRAAWRGAAAAGLHGELARAAEGLLLLFETRARYTEGAELLDAAIAAIAPAPDGRATDENDADGRDAGGSDADDPRRRSALGRTLAARARLSLKLARFDASIAQAERALTLLRGADDARGAMNAHAVLGAALLAPGDTGRVRRHMRTALELAERIGDRERAAAYLHNLGVVEADAGDPDEARRLIERALVEQRAMDDPKGIVYSLSNLSHVVFAEGAGDADYAERLLREGLELVERHGLRSMRPWLVNQLGMVASSRGDHAAARARCREALDDARASGDRSVEAWVHATLGRVALADPGIDPAAEPRGGEVWRHVRSGLEIAWATREIPMVLSLVVLLGELRLRQGRTAQAGELLQLARAHPAGDRLVRARAEAPLAELAAAGIAPATPDDPENELAQLVDAVVASTA